MSLRKIPRFELNTDAIVGDADNLFGYDTYTSDIDGTEYIVDNCGDEILVITKSNGYIRMKENDLKILVNEFSELQEIMKRR